MSASAIGSYIESFTQGAVLGIFHCFAELINVHSFVKMFLD